MAFVHHNHSDFSILDGASRVPDMVSKAVEFGMPALALTDHGYLFGIPQILTLVRRKYNEVPKLLVPMMRNVLKRAGIQKSFLRSRSNAGEHDVHAQWASDVQIWNQTHDIEAEGQ